MLFYFLVSVLTPGLVITLEDWTWESQMRDNLEFFCFWVWVTSLTIVFSLSVHLPACFTLFSWAVLHSIYVSWFHYPSISWRTFRSVSSQAIINRATKNIAEQVSLAICQGVVEPGLMVDLFLGLWELLIPISRVTASFCHTTNSECVFSLLTSPPAFCCPLLVDVCFSDWSKMKSQSCLNLHFPNCCECWNIFFWDIS